MAVLLTEANRHDNMLFEGPIDGTTSIRQPSGQRRNRPTKLHADKAYDIPRWRRFLHRRHIQVRIGCKGIESKVR